MASRMMIRPAGFAAAVAVCVAIGATVSGAQSIETRKLSDVRARIGDVEAAAITPDGARVVYLADQDEPDRIELWSVPTTGGVAVRLNGPLEPFENVVDFALSDDSAWVVFRTRLGSSRQALWSVSVAGGVPRLLNGPLQQFARIDSYRIAPGSQHVLYVADQEARNQLWSVSLAGGSPVRLNAPELEVLSDFAASPTGARVAFLGCFFQPSRVCEAWQVPVGGGTATRLHAPLGFDRNVFGLAFAAGGNRVLYIADLATNERFDLWSVDVSGGGPIRLGPAAADDLDVRDLAITADGQRAVFTLGRSIGEPAALYSVPVSGGTTVRLDGSRGELLAGTEAVVLSADGQRVAYRAAEPGQSGSSVFSVPVEGGVAAVLGASDAERVGSFHISPDGTRIAFTSIPVVGGAVTLYSVATTGGVPARLTPPRDALNLFNVQWSRDSAAVIFQANLENQRVIELFAAPGAGGPVRKLNPALVRGGSVTNLADEASGRVVYLADQETDDVVELFAAPVSGGASTKLNGPVLAIGGRVTDLAVTPDGAHAFFLAEASREDVFELLGVEIATGRTTRIDGMEPFGSGVYDFELVDDGRQVLYRARQSDATTLEVYLAPAEGGPSIQLSTASLHRLGGVKGYRMSPDGARVVYAADQDRPLTRELYSVPSAGGDVTKIADALPNSFGFHIADDFAITPTSNRVVYRRPVLGGVELLSVPIAGGAPTLLAGPAEDDNGVAAFEVTPDAASVIYLADADRPSILEIYRVPVTGGASVRLSHVEPTDFFHGVEAMALSEGGRWVIYRYNSDFDEPIGLWSVPVAGGVPIRLDQRPAEDGGVSDFVLHPDGMRAIYRARSGNAPGLFEVPLAGGTARRIDQVPEPYRGATFRFHITPDGERVVWVGSEVDNRSSLWEAALGGGVPKRLSPPTERSGSIDQVTLFARPGFAVFRGTFSEQDPIFFEGRFDLLHVPVPGGVTVQLNPPLPEGGNLDPIIAVAAAGTAVLYVGELERPGVHDLYVATDFPARLRLDDVTPSGAQGVGSDKVLRGSGDGHAAALPER